MGLSKIFNIDTNLPLTRIAEALERLVELKELEMRMAGIYIKTKTPGADDQIEVYYGTNDPAEAAVERWKQAGGDVFELMAEMAEPTDNKGS